jgi:hypothetical protein
MTHARFSRSIPTRRVLAALASTSLVLVAIGSLAGAAHAATTDGGGIATVTGSDCAGTTGTLSWIAPNIDGVTGYHIVGQNIVFPSQIPAPTYDVTPDQTSLQFPVQFGGTEFNVYADTAAGLVPFATVDAAGIQAPQPMQWDSYGDGQNLVSNHSVTVAFAWPAYSSYFYSGGTGDTVTVTASPGGATITSAVGANQGATDTFMRLKNGVSYTFTSVVSNECGSSATQTSAPLVPSASGGLTCTVSGTASQKSVQIGAPDGLSGVANISSVNSTVNVSPFTPGTTVPVVVTIAKTAPGQKMSWGFDISDMDGHTHHCGS